MPNPVRLHLGDPAPNFRASSSIRPEHIFDVQAGRYVVISFVVQERLSEAGLVAALARTPLAHQGPAQHWFVLRRPLDEALTADANVDGRVRYFLDPRDEIRQLYGVASDAGLVSFVLTPRFHVAGAVWAPAVADHVAALHQSLAAQVPAEDLSRVFGTAPVLIIPHVFEPDLCQLLIAGYEKHGGQTSYYMREENGRTVPRLDSGFKVRRDWLIEERPIQQHIEARFARRVVPEIQRAFNFKVEHLERHLVACYAASEGGHFAAHRDNNSKGTEHRRFACSLNLNEDYDGGTLVFPEFGVQQYRPPPGACVIFSSGLLHQANRVTKGRRYAYLPFLHDAAADAIFRANLHLVDRPPAESPAKSG